MRKCRRRFFKIIAQSAAVHKIHSCNFLCLNYIDYLPQTAATHAQAQAGSNMTSWMSPAATLAGVTAMNILELLLAIAGGVGIIGGAGAVIGKVIAPAFKLVRRVEELETHGKKDYGVIHDIKETNRMLCKGIIVLLDHAATGDSVENIIKARKELTDFLVETK